MIDFRSHLARLFAAENIFMRVDPNAPTAYFDMEKRIIGLPQFKKEVPFCVWGRFLGHEASHGLFTPAKEYSTAVKNTEERFRALYGTIVNVCEDPRIDNLMIIKYPGLMKYYRDGIRYLNKEFGFFVKGVDNNKDENIIDRLIYHFKSVKFGGEPEKPFPNAKEQDFADRIERAREFSEVKQIADEILEYLKNDQDFMKKFEQAEQDAKNAAEMLQQLIKSVETELKAMGKMIEGGAQKIEQLMKGDLEGKGFGIKMEGNPAGDKKGNSQGSGYHDPYRTDGDYAIPLVPRFVEKFQRESANHLRLSHAPTHVGEKYAGSRTIAQQLFMEFQRKKAGLEHTYGRHAKTGNLDLNKMNSFKFNDDIFQRRTEDYQHKNHAVLILVDMSGSMSSYGDNVKRWVYTLTDFFRRLQIPFEVIGFSSSDGTSINFQMETIAQGPQMPINVRLKKYMTNKTKPTEAQVLINGMRFDGGTPLNEALVFMRSYADQYFSAQKKNINNLILITDGESNTDFYTKRHNVVVDKTSRTHIMNPDLEMTGKLLKLLGQIVPNLNVVGIRITSDIRSGSYRKVVDKNSLYDNFFYVSTNLDTNQQNLKNFVREFSDEISGYKQNFARINSK